MKRLFLCLAAVAALTFTACTKTDADNNDKKEAVDDKDDDNPEKKQDEPGKQDEPQPTIYNSEECKTIFENTAIEAVSLVKASDFESVYNLLMTVASEVMSSDLSAVEEWAMPAIESVGEITSYLTSKWTEENTWYSLEETTYALALSLAPFTGHLTLSADGEWTCEEASDLMVTMPGLEGDCVVKLETSGKTSKITLFDYNNFEKIYDWEGDADEDGYIEHHYNVIKKDGSVTVELPGNIHLTATDGKSTIADVSIDASADVKGSPRTDDIWDTDVINSAKFKLGFKAQILDYCVTSDEISLGDKKGLVALSIAKGAEKIISLNLDINNWELLGYPTEGTVMPSIETASLEADVLGKMQLKGNCSFDRLIANINDAYEDYNNEAGFKQHVEEANKNLDVKIYFGDSTEQASIKLDSFSNNGYWSFMPTLCFQDGSSYAFGDYFTEASFKKLLSKLSELIEDLQNIVSVE